MATKDYPRVSAEAALAATATARARGPEQAIAATLTKIEAAAEAHAGVDINDVEAALLVDVLAAMRTRIKSLEQSTAGHERAKNTARAELSEQAAAHRALRHEVNNWIAEGRALLERMP